METSSNRVRSATGKASSLPEKKGRTPRIKFFDLETTHLKADWGDTLCGCVAYSDSNKIKTFSIEDYPGKNAIDDNQLVMAILNELSTADMIVGWYCSTPDHKVLTNDLQWVEVGNLAPGDKLLAFDENIPGPGKRRKFRESCVLETRRMFAPCVEVSLSDGSKLKVTNNHPFLVCNVNGNLSNHKWKVSSDLHIGDRIPRFLPVWKSGHTWQEGYLAGFFDGEGCLSFGGNNGSCIGVQAYQNINATIPKIKECLSCLGIDFNINFYDNRSINFATIGISSKPFDFLHFLGRTRPQRLLDNFSKVIDRLGSLRTRKDKKNIFVTSIKEIGLQEIVGLSTTSKTYFLDGFASHNSGGFDYKFLLTKCVEHRMIPPPKPPHLDLWLTPYKDWLLFSNRLANVQQFLNLPEEKTNIWKKNWRLARTGDRKALRYIIGHCQQDVKVLKQAYYEIRPYIYSHPTLSLQTGGSCPVCGSLQIKKDGIRHKKTGSYQRYACLACKHPMTDSKRIGHVNLVPENL